MLKLFNGVDLLTFVQSNWRCISEVKEKVMTSLVATNITITTKDTIVLHQITCICRVGFEYYKSFNLCTKQTKYL